MDKLITADQINKWKTILFGDEDYECSCGYMDVEKSVDYFDGDCVFPF